MSMKNLRILAINCSDITRLEIEGLSLTKLSLNDIEKRFSSVGYNLYELERYFELLNEEYYPVEKYVTVIILKEE